MPKGNPQSYQAARRALRKPRGSEDIRRGRGRRGRCLQVPLFGMKGTLPQGRSISARGHTSSSEYYADSRLNAEVASSSRANMMARDPTDAAAGACEPLTGRPRRSVWLENGRAVGSVANCVHSDTPNAVPIGRPFREAVRPYLAAALSAASQGRSDQGTRNSWYTDKSFSPLPGIFYRKPTRPAAYNPMATRSRMTTRLVIIEFSEVVQRGEGRRIGKIVRSLPRMRRPLMAGQPIAE